MKRAAKVLFGKQNKRAKHEVDISVVPENFKEDWTEYSSLQHMNASPMATTVLESLTKKATDLNFMLKFCAAATEEGSGHFQTRLLGSVRKEARFHRLVAKDLPLVENIKLPVKIRNKLHFRKFSPLPNADLPCMFCYFCFVIFSFLENPLENEELQPLGYR